MQSSSRYKPEPTQTEPDIFARLANRNVEYWEIKQVYFDIPQYALLFERQFGERTFKQALDAVTRWKDVLKNDCLLPLGLRAEVERTVLATESIVWQAIIEVNDRVGDWQLQWIPIPTGQGEAGPVYIDPGVRVIAHNSKTKEIREHVIPGEKWNDLKSTGETVRQAFEKLGLWEILWRGRSIHRLTSKRLPQGWPLYTKSVIPRLYELLAPRYQLPGHHSEKTDANDPKLKRPARFPQELLEDMLEILRLETPTFFQDTTLAQLKAVVQRHLSRKENPQNTPK